MKNKGIVKSPPGPRFPGLRGNFGVAAHPPGRFLNHPGNGLLRALPGCRLFAGPS
jgi:hypothetical protein